MSVLTPSQRVPLLRKEMEKGKESEEKGPARKVYKMYAVCDEHG